jgi:hypothetical protein
MPPAALAPAHRSFLIRDHIVGAAVLNLILNAVIGWAVFRSLTTVPFWGPQSVATDIIATAFILPFVSCVVISAVTRSQVRRHKLPAPTWPASRYPLLARLPKSTLLRGAVLGVVASVAVGVPVVLTVHAFEVTEMGLGYFVAFKAIFGATLAAGVSPVIALRALSDTSSRRT